MGKIRYGTAAGVTAQQIFNKVWKHFIVNKAPRGIVIDAEGERCVYRTESGAACAVGVCLRNNEVPTYNASPSTSWLPPHLHKHVWLLHALQKAHDGYGGGAIETRTDRRKMAAAFRRVAKGRGLRVPA